MTTFILAAALAAPSSTCFRQSVTYAHPVYAAPVVKYVAPVQHVNVYYGVGQAVQLSALVTKQLRSDIEYQQFLSWKAAKKQALQQQYEQQQQHAQPMPPQHEQGQPLPLDPMPPPQDPAPPREPTPPPAQPVATVIETCAKCHSGAAPKGNFLLDGVSPLDDIAKPVEMVMTGAMPPLVGENGEQLDTHRLTPLERYQIIEDLIRLKQLGEQE
jgi:hypothetical protein